MIRRLFNSITKDIIEGRRERPKTEYVEQPTTEDTHGGHEELKELNLPEKNIVYCTKPIERLKKDT